jgi:hypothetical protein
MNITRVYALHVTTIIPKQMRELRGLTNSQNSVKITEEERMMINTTRAKTQEKRDKEAWDANMENAVDAYMISHFEAKRNGTKVKRGAPKVISDEDVNLAIKRQFVNDMQKNSLNGTFFSSIPFATGCSFYTRESIKENDRQ